MYSAKNGRDLVAACSNLTIRAFVTDALKSLSLGSAISFIYFCSMKSSSALTQSPLSAGILFTLRSTELACWLKRNNLSELFSALQYIKEQPFLHGCPLMFAPKSRTKVAESGATCPARMQRDPSAPDGSLCSFRFSPRSVARRHISCFPSGGLISSCSPSAAAAAYRARGCRALLPVCPAPRRGFASGDCRARP